MTTAVTKSVDKREAGAVFGQAAVVIWNDVSREGREQFYAWHDQEHIPERLSILALKRSRTRPRVRPVSR